MKKKLIITIAVIVALIISGITAGVILSNSLSFSIGTGVVLKSENGTCFLIKNNSPVRLCDYSEKGDRFEDLSDGDKVLVFHNSIAESYPASTLAYCAIKLQDGTIEDVPEAVITSLTQLGWFGSAENGSDLIFTDTPVSSYMDCLKNSAYSVDD